MTYEKHLYYKGFSVSKRKTKAISFLPLITARCRWHTCAAPSCSSAAPRGVWLSASCLWTERSVPGSETAAWRQSHSQQHPTYLSLNTVQQKQYGGNICVLDIAVLYTKLNLLFLFVLTHEVITTLLMSYLAFSLFHNHLLLHLFNT